MVPEPIHCFVHFLLKCYFLIGVFPDHLIQKHTPPPFPTTCFSFLHSPLYYLHYITCSLTTSSPWWSIPWHSVISLLCSQCPEECLAPWETQQISVNEWMIEKKIKRQWLRNTRRNVLSLKELEKVFQEAECPSISDGDDGQRDAVLTLDLGAGVPPISLLLVWQRLLCKDGHCSLESNSKTLTQTRMDRPH